MVKRDEVEIQEKLTNIFKKYNKRIGLKKMSDILFENVKALEKASKEIRAY